MSESTGSASAPAAPRAGQHALTRWLAQAPPWVFSAYAVAMAFTTYFCMYSFRKPYTAAGYEGPSFGALEFQIALVLSQTIGYAISKFSGIKINSEMPRHRRAWALLLFIVWAELALVLFAVLPGRAKILALFLNGLPLGMVWGLVFSFLEGRRTSEILGAGLSCSYIVASGYVKSAGKWLIVDQGVNPFWMPALTGLLFLPLFLLAVYGLSLLPNPSAEDIAARVDRAPMTRHERWAFTRRYWFGLLLLVITYFFLTAFRSVRDDFEGIIWAELGFSEEPAVFASTANYIAFAVMLALALLYLIRSNRLGLLATFAIMLIGSALVGVSTLLFDIGAIGPMAWMILVGLGLYLAYVPYGCVLFDRMIAALGVVATSVFLIYVSDAIGYSGSVGVLLYKNFGQSDISMLEFLRGFSYVMSVVTSILFVLSAVYFMRRAEHD
ncbi:MAG: DUF5690 family protein [Myxococcota bacterium]